MDRLINWVAFAIVVGMLYIAFRPYHGVPDGVTSYLKQDREDANMTVVSK